MIQCSKVQCSVHIWIIYAATISFKYQPSTRLLYYKFINLYRPDLDNPNGIFPRPYLDTCLLKGFYISSLSGALPFHGPNLFKFPLAFMWLHCCNSALFSYLLLGCPKVLSKVMLLIFFKEFSRLYQNSIH